MLSDLRQNKSLVNVVFPDHPWLVVGMKSAMKLNQLKSDQLEAYLTALTPKAAEFLIREVERDRLRGGNSYPHSLVLERARQVIRNADRRCDRFPTPQRVFCTPLEGLLVNQTTDIKQTGRIERSSIDKIWNWLLTESGSDALLDIEKRMTVAASAENVEATQYLAKQLYDVCFAALSSVLDDLSPDTKTYQQLVFRLGGERVLQDAIEMRDCMSCASDLTKHLARVPEKIQSLQDDDLQLYQRWYDEFEEAFPKHAYVLLLSLHERCAHTSDFLRIVVQIAGSNESQAMEPSKVGVVIDALLHDVEIAADVTRKCVLSTADPALVQVQLAEFYNQARALCDAVELDLRGAWGNRLVAMRSSLSSAIRDKISHTPRLLKAALYRKSSGMRGRVVNSSRTDPDKVKEAEFAVNLLLSLRSFLGQLTLNADFTRVSGDVEQFLEIIAERLLRDIRDGEDDQRSFALDAYPAAGRMMSAVFGTEASELYLRRARAAMQVPEAATSA